MKRTFFNLLIDLLAAFGLLGMIITGYILRFPLPPTTNRTYELWSLSRHEWGTIHSWASLGLLGVLAVHLALHWEWIFATVRRCFTTAKAAPGQRLRAGILTVAAVAIILGAFAWATHAGVRKRETPLHSLRSAMDPRGLPSSSEPDSPVMDLGREVRTIFEASCTGCHGPGKQRAGFRADRRGDFFSPRDTGTLIVPGRAESSRLIALVSGEVTNIKSAEAHLLQPQEITLLKAWIDAGAEWPEMAERPGPSMQSP